MADITAAFSAAFRAQAEQMQGACMEFVKTNVDPSMKTDDEFIEFCAPFAKLTSERGISPDRFVEILFEVLHSLAQLNQIERPTLIVCINVGVMKILNDTKDQPAALPGAEGVGKDKAAYNAALSDRDHVVDVLTAWLAAKEKHMQANKPNPSAGRADTEMDAPEDDFADDEMAAGEAAKNDEPVAAADAIDRMVVSALLEKASTSTDDKVKEVMAYMASRQASDHQPRSHNNAGRSKPIELFHGKPEQCGKDAKDWLSTVEIYLDSVTEKKPVSIVVTYLRGDAQSWWTEFGKAQIGLQASFVAFKDIFLARFVKPGDSRKARHELATMQQNEMSVETYAAQFRNCAARIAASKVGTPVDSTTQATYFLKGLKKLIVYKLEGMVSPDVMQDVDKLIDAAEKVEANIDMSMKQAKGHSQEQPQYDRPRGQANFVDRNRGGSSRFRSAPYSTHGRGRGAAVHAVQALPPQEVQFNFAQARDEHHPANRWAPNEVCNNCRQTGHKWRECPSLPHQYMPAPQAWGGPSGGRGRGRGMAGRSRGRGYGY
ncbi:TPA: hypothetical protein ACH3X2_012846 [Trebouxia sp. C0005]